MSICGNTDAGSMKARNNCFILTRISASGVWTREPKIPLGAPGVADECTRPQLRQKKNRRVDVKLTVLVAGLLSIMGVASADVRVNTAEALKAAVSKPQPEYSPIARQMKVAGKVEVEAVVDTEGKVASVKALNGNPLLTQSAVNAVQKWKFTPFTADGQPTKAVVTLSFDFRP
jgi:TonB family protein